MDDLGAVIVTHNSAEVIGACLDSCAALHPVVVDNFSRDRTVDEVKRRPFARLIRNPENKGFAAGVNQGVTLQNCEFILLLNPDVELASPIQPLVEACREPATALATGKLVGADGQPQTGFTIRRFPTGLTLAFEVLGINRLFRNNPVNRSYRYLDADLLLPQAVEQPAGAFLMFRRSLWMELGGFDSTFHPLWFEDVDFCRRAANSGWKAQYLPVVTAKHLGAHSIAKLDWASREVYWYASLLKYASKHYRPWIFRGVSAAVVFGSVLRLIGGVISRKSFEPATVYARVIRLAARSLWSGRVLSPSPVRLNRT